MHVAAAKGRACTVIVLYVTPQGQKLWQACYDGELVAVNEALRNGADLNWKNNEVEVELCMQLKLNNSCINDYTAVHFSSRCN